MLLIPIVEQKLEKYVTLHVPAFHIIKLRTCALSVKSLQKASGFTRG
jgi:hypothetical protein